MCDDFNNDKEFLFNFSSQIFPCLLSGPRGNNTNLSQNFLSVDHYRMQFYQYNSAERLMNHFTSTLPRFPFVSNVIQQEEPKPQFSYIGLIAKAILSTPEKKLVLSDIYQYILNNYPYFRSKGPGWRNSIRHNLSLNDCFVKIGRSANGKGHYWSIHPANMEDFRKGDFRRRKAQKMVRKHMGFEIENESTNSRSSNIASNNDPAARYTSAADETLCTNNATLSPIAATSNDIDANAATTAATAAAATATADVTCFVAINAKPALSAGTFPEPGKKHKAPIFLRTPIVDHSLLSSSHFSPSLSSSATSSLIEFGCKNNCDKCKRSKSKRRRQFNVESLLAPDSSDEIRIEHLEQTHKQNESSISTPSVPSAPDSSAVTDSSPPSEIEDSIHRNHFNFPNSMLICSKTI